MPKPLKETQIMTRIKKSLPLFVPQVFHVDRLNSGKIDLGHRFIHLCVAGTPDLYALLNVNGGVLLFIEVKRPGGRLSPKQVDFKKMVAGFTNIHYCVAFKVGDVIRYINENILTENNQPL